MTELKTAIKNKIFIENDFGSLSFSSVYETDEISEYKLTLKYDKPTNVKNLKLKINVPMHGIISTFSPTVRRNKWLRQWFDPVKSRSAYYFGSPFISAVNHGKDNYCTVALSDGEFCHELSLSVNDFEEKNNLDFIVNLFVEQKQIKDYSVIIRVDKRKIELSDALSSLTEWWDGFYPQIAPLPESRGYPLYSSWYNFHQHPESELLLKELEIASKVGFKTLIIDDGWQYDGLGTADYYDCGDWDVSKEKFPDLKAFVEKAHKLGIAVMLWFPLPFVGYNTKAYVKFKDKLLYEQDFNTRAGILDPRYKEVRDHISDTVCALVKNYGLDGVKLDFMDSFLVKPETPKFNENMDVVDVDVATVKLMDELVKALKALNESVLLEYRQDYVGPSVTKHGNLLRVADCAFDSTTNRVGIGDMRLMNYKCAVHSDMLYWSNTESLLNCRKQLLNIAFSCPQISVLLTKSTDEQIELLKKFVSYYSENKDILLYGKFSASDVDVGYSAMRAESKEKRIAVNYMKNDYVFDGKAVDLFNATDSERMVVYNDDKKDLTIKIYDMFSNLLSQTNSSQNVVTLTIPLGGYVTLK